jgi:hypothetical protein
MVMQISEASETDLLTAWLKLVSDRGDKLLTRSWRTEVRHVCYYTGIKLTELRNMMARDDVPSRFAIIEVREAIADLQGILRYLETGRGGGTSALHDRNK